MPRLLTLHASAACCSSTSGKHPDLLLATSRTVWSNTPGLRLHWKEGGDAHPLNCAHHLESEHFFFFFIKKDFTKGHDNDWQSANMHLYNLSEPTSEATFRHARRLNCKLKQRQEEEPRMNTADGNSRGATAACTISSTSAVQKGACARHSPPAAICPPGLRCRRWHSSHCCH